MADPTSTGRGGAGNIGHDPNTYIDGEIVREGVVGQPGHPDGGDYSAGRGGAGNMVDSPAPDRDARHPPPPSRDSIPETAMREQTPEYANFHTGRGGGGNIHKDKYGGHSTKKEQEEAEKREREEKAKKEGLMEKAKHAMGMHKKE